MADSKLPRKAPPTPKADQIGAYLKEHLVIRVKSGGFTDPNGRTIQLVLKDEVISETSIDISQRREYEG